MDELVRLARPEIVALEPYSSARVESAEHSSDISIYLDANENPYPPFGAGLAQSAPNRYPEPQPRALLERFAKLYDVSTGQLFFSRGADEAIDLLMRVFCRAGTDSVVITPPTFVMYETAVAIQGGRVHRIQLTPDTFQLDADRIIQTCHENSQVKLVFVCSPNNPTANLMRRSDVLRVAREVFGKAIVVVDQTYVDFSGEPSYVQEIAKHPNIVVLRTLSKEYSLAGERFGITVAHPSIINILTRVMAPYPIPASVIASVTKATTAEGLTYGRANIATIVAERDRVASALKAHPHVTRVFPSDANFLLVQVADVERTQRVLADAGIRVRDRSDVVPETLRISIGTPEENDRLFTAFDVVRDGS